MKQDAFDLNGRVVVITGGAGLLGRQHAAAVAARGAIPVILDLSEKAATSFAGEVTSQFGVSALGLSLDITTEEGVARAARDVKTRFGKIDVLINNAANNPQVKADGSLESTGRLEHFSLDAWQKDLAVGLTGSFLCAKHFGAIIATNPSGGSIINVSSDLGIIAPDQRLYRRENTPEERQNAKPVTYSVVKTGLIGLTRYLATYWADKGVRSNALCPGGVFNGQDEGFVQRVSSLIPMGRMAQPNEYHGAIVFLASDASRYMTGAVLIVDGGRTCW